MSSVLRRCLVVVAAAVLGSVLVRGNDQDPTPSATVWDRDPQQGATAHNESPEEAAFIRKAQDLFNPTHVVSGDDLAAGLSELIRECRRDPSLRDYLKPVPAEHAVRVYDLLLSRVQTDEQALKFADFMKEIVTVVPAFANVLLSASTYHAKDPFCAWRRRLPASILDGVKGTVRFPVDASTLPASVLDRIHAIRTELGPLLTELQAALESWLRDLAPYPFDMFPAQSQAGDLLLKNPTRQLLEDLAKPAVLHTLLCYGIRLPFGTYLCTVPVRPDDLADIVPVLRSRHGELWRVIYHHTQNTELVDALIEILKPDPQELYMRSRRMFMDGNFAGIGRLRHHALRQTRALSVSEKFQYTCLWYVEPLVGLYLLALILRGMGALGTALARCHRETYRSVAFFGMLAVVIKLAGVGSIPACGSLFVTFLLWILIHSAYWANARESHKNL